MWFASYLCQKGIITGDQFAEAVREQLSRRPLLGALAMRKGKLTVKQSSQILSAQADDLEKPFGQLAVELGFLTRDELTQLVVDQAESVPSLGEILVETGVLSRDRMLDELRRAREDVDDGQPANKPVLVTD